MDDDRIMVVNALIQKLGHKLEEIRCRTLRSIVNKLERDLIDLEDVVNNRELMVNLLEWFNHKNVSEEELALNFLTVLSKHPSGAQTLADVGAVAFLTQLRGNFRSRALKEAVEEILDNLYKIPDASEHIYENNCAYSPRYKPSESGDGDVLEVAGLTERISPRPPAPLDQPSIGYFNRSSSTNTSQVTGTTGSSHAERRLRPGRLPVVHENAEPKARDSESKESALKAPYMPWLALAPTDRRVLSSTLSSLKHRNSKVVAGAVEFMRDVVLVDFPVEIFLQRPSILNTLFSIASCGELELVKPTAECLTVFCRRVMERIRYHQSPDNYCTKQIVSNRPFTGGCLLRNYSPASVDAGHGGDVCPDLEDVTLQSRPHYSIPSVSVDVLGIVLNQLGGVFTEDVYPSLLELLHCVIRLLGACLQPSVWTCTETRSAELVPRMIQVLEKWACVLERLAQREEKTAPESGQPRQLYIALLIGLLKFCRTLVPVKESLVVLPIGVKDELAYAANDETFCEGYPDMGGLLLDYVTCINSEVKKIWETVDLTGRNMQSLCQFLVAKEEGIKAVPRCLQHAAKGVHALHFVSCTRFAREFVLFYSDICTYDMFWENSERDDGRSVLLNLFAHPTLSVQKAAYGQAFDILKDCLSVVHAAEPGNLEYRRGRFLLHRDVLYEILNCGTCHENVEVATLASSLLLHLLDGRAFMSESQWASLQGELSQITPLLQVHSNTESRLGRIVLELADPPRLKDIGGDKARLEEAKFETLRVSARLLLHSLPSVRAEGMLRVARALEQEEKSGIKIGLGDGPGTARAHFNWLMVDRPRALERPPTSRSAYQAESLFKVLEILFAENVDPPVRKSAGEQVAIFLQNPNLHDAFQQREGVRFVVNLMKRAVFKDEACLTPIVPPCVTILRRVAHFSIPLCAQLSMDRDFVLALLRVGLYFNYDSQCKYDVSHLLSLILFHELSRKERTERKTTGPDGDGDEVAVADSAFLLPAAIVANFHLPFRCPEYDQLSPFRPRPPANRVLVMERRGSQRALRIRWAAACHGGYETLLRDLEAVPALFLEDEFTERLALTALDRYLLLHSLPHLAIQESLNLAANATKHRDVRAAVTRLLLLLRASSSAPDILAQKKFLLVFRRFLLIQPTVSADFELLERVLDLLETFMTIMGPLRLPEDFRAELLSLLGPQDEGQPERPVRALLLHGEKLVGETDSPRLVQRKLWMSQRVVKFYAVLVSHLGAPTAPRMEDDDLVRWECLLGEVSFALLSRLSEVLHSGPFAHLSLLDSLVACLLHASSQACWGRDSAAVDATIELCGRLVAVYFHDRDDAAVSFMGVRVFRCVLLLLANVASRLRRRGDGGDLRMWMQQSWLPQLLGFRMSEIRAMALSIAARMVAHSEELGKRVDDIFKDVMIPEAAAVSNASQKGIWGVALHLLGDAAEASAVRREATNVLANLLSREMRDVDPWLQVADEAEKRSYRGQQALMYLMETTRFSEMACDVFNNYYPYPFVIPREVQSQELQTAVARKIQDMSSVSSSSTVVLDMNETVAATLESMTRARNGESEGSSSVAEPVAAAAGSPVFLVSLSSPSLVSAVSQLCCSLLHHTPANHLLTQLLQLKLDALLMNILDPELLESYLRLNRYPATFVQLCRVYGAVLRLLRSLCLRDSAVRERILADSRFCLRLVRLLFIRGAPDVVVRTLWTELGWLFSVLLAHGPSSELSSNLVTPMAARVAEFSTALMESWAGAGESRRAMLVCLAAVLGNKAAVGCRLVQSLDSELKGGELMRALIGVYDSLALRTQSEEVLEDKHAVNNAMKTLAALSVSAKKAAIDAGLVESLMEYIKYLQNKLHIEVVVLPNRPGPGQKSSSRAAIQREMNFGYLNDLSLTLDILHNLVYLSSDAKQACVDAGLAQTVHRMWTLCQLDERLMVGSLRLLINFSASFPPAGASLAFTSPLASSDAPGQHSTSSLVHVLVKLVGGTSLTSAIQREGLMAFRLVYALLCNIVWSTEARGILWKSKFLHRFTEINPKALNKSKNGQLLQALWLRLFLNLSFVPEGQKFIVRVPDSINILTEQVESLTGKQLYHVLLILRNLSTHSKVRAKLMAAECRLIPCLNRHLDEGNTQLCQLVLSTLQALLYNNQKAKVSLKSEGFLQKALEMMDRCQSSMNPPEPLFTNLRVVLAAMQD